MSTDGRMLPCVATRIGQLSPVIGIFACLTQPSEAING